MALALSHEFECDVNDLPLTLVLSWFEQKAIVILSALLSFGVKGIYVGLTLPAFLMPDLLRVLQDKFDLRPKANARDDIETVLNGKSA